MFRKTLVTLFITLSSLVMANASFAQGRKMGLFVGIDAYQGSPLKSCVNDAVAMQSKLSRSFGFEVSNMSLLTNEQATREAILTKLTDYERKAAKGDLFVFYYSGHGSVFPDAYSLVADETEQFGVPEILPTGYYDSTLVPVDTGNSTGGKAWGNMILDDELNEIFARFTAKGVQVIFISDSCHSGTLAKNLDLNKTKTHKFVAPKTIGFDSAGWKEIVTRKGTRSENNFNKMFLVIGSSQDNQTSEAGIARGELSLFTKVLIAKIDEFSTADKTFSYQSIVDVVAPEVNILSRGGQTPRLDDRFFPSAMLSKPLFSLPNNPSGDRMRVVVKVTDEGGAAITDAGFGIFKSGADITKGNVKSADALLLGKTDRKGLVDSGERTFELGRYQVKIVKEGYRAFISEIEVVGAKNNTLVLVFKLVSE